jgi:hypothetical protein
LLDVDHVHCLLVLAAVDDLGAPRHLRAS